MTIAFGEFLNLLYQVYDVIFAIYTSIKLQFAGDKTITFLGVLVALYAVDVFVVNVILGGDDD